MNFTFFAQRLKLSRILKGLPQIDLAGKTGVDQGLISKYESNKITVAPKVDTIYALSQVLEVSCEYLLGIEEEFAKSPISKENDPLFPLKKVENHSSTHVKRIFDYIRMPVENPVDFFIQNDNDDMQPLLKNGGLLFFRSDGKLQNNRIILFRKKGEGNNCVRYCKIIQEIQLLSPNPAISAIKLTVKDFISKYNVLGVMTGYWENIHGSFGQNVF